MALKAGRLALGGPESWRVVGPSLRRKHAQRRALAGRRPASVLPSRDLDPPLGSVQFLCVYRHRNAEILSALIDQADLDDIDLRLWALDRAHPTLERWTVGAGPGTKFGLLNRLLEPSDGRAEWAVFADDDVILHRGTVTDLLRIGRRAGFSLLQPAHAKGSYRSYDITLARPGLRARETTYVEIGPLFALDLRQRRHFLPFPDGIGMGWGLEFRWAAAREHGCRLGIVDDVRVVHLVPPALSYPNGPEVHRLERCLEEAGLASVVDGQATLGAWRRRRSSPPWAQPDMATA